jgi:hypothetical protein
MLYLNKKTSHNYPDEEITTRQKCDYFYKLNSDYLKKIDDLPKKEQDKIHNLNTKITNNDVNKKYTNEKLNLDKTKPLDSIENIISFAEKMDKICLEKIVKPPSSVDDKIDDKIT